MKGRDLVQEAQNLKESIRLAKLAVGFIAILLVGMMVGMLSGCASTPTNTVTAPSGRVMDDMGAYDDHITALCYKRANEVVLGLVMADPSAFTIEKVEEIHAYIMSNCIRDNGRST